MSCRRCGNVCRGPCYDLCMCSHCWRGWDRVAWWRKILWRIRFLLEKDETS